MASVVIIGGGGHVGLPLGLVLASKNYNVIALDINAQVVEQINRGIMPFMESGANELLERVLQSGNFRATSDKRVISAAEIIILCVGTPVDEHLSPVPRIFVDLLEGIREYLSPNQLLILRSTVYPGTTRLAESILQDSGVQIAFCPERILQGKAIEELQILPSIVSGCSDSAEKRASEFLSNLAPVVVASVEEAEFAKLFLNTFRYVEFAISNQLFTIANDAGVDYSRVLQIMKEDYPRARQIPSAGFSAGPCLMKDTMQLVAYSQNKFSLGVSAFFANEGLALYVVDQILKINQVGVATVGILGMAFKGEIDDIRSSLSYRIRKALLLAGIKVLSADDYVKQDLTLISEERLVNESTIIVIGAPHDRYATFEFGKKTVIDVWNILGNGNLIKA